MQVAFGLKSHSGWAALVVVACSDGEPEVLDRRRIELVSADDVHWAKQPYHAAVGLPPPAAKDLVDRAIRSARQIAVRELRAAIKRAGDAKQEVCACAVLAPSPMPDWSVAQILAVHIRMHKAEGVLFPEALTRAAVACALKIIAIPEKELAQLAAAQLQAPASELTAKIAALGKSVGPPWGSDQKGATLAAMVALHQARS